MNVGQTLLAGPWSRPPTPSELDAAWSLPANPPDLNNTANSQVPIPEVSGSLTTTTPERDGFLDIVRSIAVLRVILWHALGAPILTYLVAAVPAIVFVSGSLLTRSLDRHPVRQVIGDRLRRLLIPYWVLAGAALTILALASLAGAHDAWPGWGALTWVVPILDPRATRFESGWISAPLWYVRLMVWMLLLIVPLRAAVRRWPVYTLAALSLGTVLAQVASARVEPYGLAGQVCWYAGDLMMFGGFLAAGVLHGDGRLAGWSPRRWLALATGALAITILGALYWPPPGGNVNHDHITLAVVGAGWLALALAANRPLTRLTKSSHATMATVAFLTRRSLTVYLWHPAAILLAYRACAGLGLVGPIRILATLACTGLGTLAACLTLGWVEDRAARRAAQIWPHGAGSSRPALPRERLGILAGASVSTVIMLLACAVLAPLGGDHRSTLESIDAPSRQPFVAPFTVTSAALTLPSGIGAAIAPAVAPHSITLGPEADGRLHDALTAEADTFLARTKLRGVRVVVSRPGLATAHIARGTTEKGVALNVATPVQAMSISKTFLAVIVTQLAAEGRIKLNAPLPPLRALARPTALTKVTPWQLLTHHTTLADYHEVVRPGELLEPIEIANRVLAQGDVTAQKRSHYSSSNAFMLAFLVEQVTGQPYARTLSERITGPWHLKNTRLGSQAETGSTWASGGVITTLDDLTRFADVLLRRREVLPASQLAAMSRVDAYGLGAGLWAFCPCETRDGTPHWSGIGHPGAAQRMEYLPDADVIVSLEFSRSQFSSPDLAVAMDAFVERLAARTDQALAPRTKLGNANQP